MANPEEFECRECCDLWNDDNYSDTEIACKSCKEYESDKIIRPFINDESGLISKGAIKETTYQLNVIGLRKSLKESLNRFSYQNRRTTYVWELPCELASITDTNILDMIYDYTCFVLQKRLIPYFCFRHVKSTHLLERSARDLKKYGYSDSQFTIHLDDYLNVSFEFLQWIHQRGITFRAHFTTGDYIRESASFENVQYCYKNNIIPTEKFEVWKLQFPEEWSRITGQELDFEKEFMAAIQETNVYKMQVLQSKFNKDLTSYIPQLKRLVQESRGWPLRSGYVEKSCLQTFVKQYLPTEKSLQLFNDCSRFFSGVDRE